MTGATLLALLALLGPGPAPDPADLTRQLGSARFAERQEAALALEALGDEALPALRAARTAPDPEVRSRAAALIQTIERRGLIRPTRVTLDFRDRPLEEVVRALTDRSGIPLRLIPAERPAQRPRRITLEDPAPVPFWEALDRLCRAAGLQPSPGPPTLFDGRSAAIGLFLQPGPPLRFIWDDGPFRVRAVSWHHQRDLVLDPEPGEPAPPTPNEQFFLQMQVLVEPRLWVRQAGPVRQLVAVDDLGQTLVPDGGEAPEAFGDSDGFGQEAVLSLTIPLRYPARPGRTVQVLRGRVPVVVSARTPDPLVIPLAGATGRTFGAGDVALVIGAIKEDPNLSRTLIELTVRSGAGAGPAASARDTAPASVRPIALMPDALESQIEVVDAQGRVLPMFLEGATVEEAEARLTLALVTDAGAAPVIGLGAPAQLRFYGLIEAPTAVTFEFADIPLP